MSILVILGYEFLIIFSSLVDISCAFSFDIRVKMASKYYMKFSPTPINLSQLARTVRQYTCGLENLKKQAGMMPQHE
jgi:hypothetical protein